MSGPQSRMDGGAKVEGCDLIEEGLMGTEPRTMFNMVVEHLLDGGSGLAHRATLLFVRSLSFS